MNKKILAVLLATLMSATMFAGMTTVSAEDDEKVPTIIEEVTQEDIDKFNKGISGGGKALPDMKVLDVWNTEHLLNKWRVHGEVKNNGTVSAGYQQTYFFRDWDGPNNSTLGRYIHSLGFGPGVTKLPYTPKFSMSGTNDILCYADFWDQVDEVDDSFEDNTREETLQFS